MVTFDLPTLIICAGIIFAAFVSGRLAHVTGKRYGIDLNRDSGYVTIAGGAAIAGVLAGFAVTAAIQIAGMMAGVVVDLLLLPAVGIIWILIVGGNRAIERLITNLLNKLDSKTSS